MVVEPRPPGRHIFGPIASRRLGRSLGIDPVPLKTCNWNCIYCQLGRTSPHSPARDEYIDADEIIDQFREHLADHGEESFDWITFVGSGEPTLHARLGWMIREVKKLAHKPVAVITNGALLSDPQVREELRVADAVMPTVSAGTEETYLRLHRPAPGLDFRSFTTGLITFRDMYEGELWAEVMLVAGHNDEEDELVALRDLLQRMRPDEIQVVLPTRPAAVPAAQPAQLPQISLAIRILSAAAAVGARDKTSPLPEVRAAGSDLHEVLAGLVQRHPMTEAELTRTMSHWSPDAVRTALVTLTEAGRIRSVERGGQRFYSSAKAIYGDDDRSE